MAKYQEKLLRGQPSAPGEWNEYLKEAHAAAPGMAPKAFEQPRAADGRNSYQILTDAAGENPTRVLDLACGDGHLTRYLRRRFGTGPEIVGVDMSDHELHAARANNADPRTRYILSMADSIPEASASFDVILCHMSLMLLDPLEPTLREVSRLLNSGGIFAGIVSGGPPTGFMLEYVNIFREFVSRRYPDYQPRNGGDARTRTSEGLRESLREWCDIEITSFAIEVRRSPETAWNFFEDMYNVTLLPPAERDELGAVVTAKARELAAGSGELAFPFPMRLFRAGNP
jgi:ubiquinone/menaquinone biosynthesis C-methylase UbiE